MEPTTERQNELEPLAIHIYQQISAGFPIDQIRGQFDNIDLAPEDVAWVLENGKQRYLGYQQFLLESNREDAKWFIVGGLALFVIAFSVVSVMGWSMAPRQNGMIYTCFALGVGAFFYGIYCWITAKPEGVRTDLD
jgi:hypothetical protein